MDDFGTGLASDQHQRESADRALMEEARQMGLRCGEHSWRCTDPQPIVRWVPIFTPEQEAENKKKPMHIDMSYCYGPDYRWETSEAGMFWKRIADAKAARKALT